MYSLVVFGWPATTMSPSRSMSTPTEIMLLARSTSTCSAPVRLAEPAFASVIFAGVLAARELDRLHLDDRFRNQGCSPRVVDRPLSSMCRSGCAPRPRRAAACRRARAGC